MLCSQLVCCLTSVGMIVLQSRTVKEGTVLLSEESFPVSVSWVASLPRPFRRLAAGPDSFHSNVRSKWEQLFSSQKQTTFWHSFFKLINQKKKCFVRDLNFLLVSHVVLTSVTCYVENAEWDRPPEWLWRRELWTVSVELYGNVCLVKADSLTFVKDHMHSEHEACIAFCIHVLWM